MNRQVNTLKIMNKIIITYYLQVFIVSFGIILLSAIKISAQITDKPLYPDTNQSFEKRTLVHMRMYFQPLKNWRFMRRNTWFCD